MGSHTTSSGSADSAHSITVVILHVCADSCFTWEERRRKEERPGDGKVSLNEDLGMGR